MPVFALTPPTGPRPVLWQLGSRALLACSLSLGVACSGGYPTNDESLLNQANMTQAPRPAAMNDIGRAGELDRRWEYVLHTDVVDKTHDVGVTPLGSLTAEPGLVLKGSTWVAPVQMRSLLQQLQIGYVKINPTAVG